MSQFKEAQTMLNLTRARQLIDRLPEDTSLDVLRTLDALWQTVYFLIAEVQETEAINSLAQGGGGGGMPPVLKFKSKEEMENFFKAEEAKNPKFKGDEKPVGQYL